MSVADTRAAWSNSNVTNNVGVKENGGRNQANQMEIRRNAPIHRNSFPGSHKGSR